MRFQGWSALFTAYLLTMMTGCVELDSSEVDNGKGMGEALSEEQQGLNEVPCEEQYSIYGSEQSICGGGGGGGGGGSYPPPSTPPAPAPTTTDTSASYLDAAAHAYLTQVGVPNSQQVGGVDYIECIATAYSGIWGSPRSAECFVSPPPGWLIVNFSYTERDRWNNLGSYSVSLMDGPVSTYSAQFGSKFNGAISLALSLGDVSVSEKLQLEYQRLNGYSTYFTGYGQKLYVKVTADGSAFQESKVTVVGRAKLLRMY